MVASYSKKPLREKLGIKKDFKIIILNAPQNYHNTLGKLPKNVTVMKTLRGPLDFIHFFTKKWEELEIEFPSLKKALPLDGVLWVSWPKSSSKVETDLNEDTIREIGLSNGLVDVKICAVD